MAYKKTEKNDVITVSISGDCTIYDVEGLHKLFLSVYNEQKEIVVDLGQIQDMDTAAFQLLIALKKEKRDISFINHSHSVLKFIDLYGLAGFFGDPIRITRDEHEVFRFDYGIKKGMEGAVNESR